MPFELLVDTEPGAVVLRPHGDLDHASSVLLLEAVDAAAASGASALVVDVSALAPQTVPTTVTTTSVIAACRKVGARLPGGVVVLDAPLRDDGGQRADADAAPAGQREG